MMRLMTIAAISASLAGCAGEAASAPDGDTSAAESTAGRRVELASYTVECGCTIDGIGKCGNYIEIDDTFVQIANGKELGLGVMEWCGQGQHTCEASGEIVDGKFVASRFTVTD